MGARDESLRQPAAAPQVAASTGSACHDGSVASLVLDAMGLDPARVAAAIRLSVGPPPPRRISGTPQTFSPPLPAQSPAPLHDAVGRYPSFRRWHRLCVVLLLELRRFITGLPAATVVHMIATDPAAPLDLPAWCHLTGHQYLGSVSAQRPTYALRLAVALVPDQRYEAMAFGLT